MPGGHCDSLLKPILEGTLHALLLLDEEYRVVVSNKQAEALLNHSAESLLNMPLRELIPSDTVDRLLASRHPKRAEAFLRDVPVSIHLRSLPRASPPKDNGLGIAAVLSIADLSLLRMREALIGSLTDSTRELSVAFDSSFDEIFVTDGDGTTLRVNPAGRRLYGMSESQLIGRNVRDLEQEGLFHPSITPLVQRSRERVTMVQETKSGKRIIATATPVMDDSGNIIRIVTNSRDVTEFHSLRSRLAESDELARRYEVEARTLRQQSIHLDGFVATSKEMQRTVEAVRKIAAFDCTVLLQGESGTGKDRIAEILHRLSLRGSGPYMKVNCGAIPEGLIESELFGYAPGAFTGAGKGGKLGVIELADKGTLFLNEIDALPSALQVKLLHVTQERQFMRVGGTRVITVDIRIIAASNKDLARLISEGKFRQDLFYRLNVVPLRLPPLRERKDDIPGLTAHFLDRLCQKYQVDKWMTPPAMDTLIGYDWPGNVRELENMLERAVITSAGAAICPEDLPVDTSPTMDRHVRYRSETEASGHGTMPGARAEAEMMLLAKAIDEGLSSREMAKLLGVSQSTIVRKLKQYGMERSTQ